MTGRRARLAPLAIVAALVVVAYAPSLGGGWLWCDDYTIAGLDAPPPVAAPLPSGPPGSEREQFHPVTDAVLAAARGLFGESPPAFRALSLAAHVAATVLLGALVARLAWPGAALAAALFGLHPLAVEAAAWVYELKTPLSLALALAAFHAWLGFERATGGRRVALLAAALALFGGATLAKSAVIVLPAWILLARGRRALVPLLPFALVAAVMAALTIAHEPPLDPGAAPDGLAERVAVAGHAFWFYVAKTLVPVRLSFAYARLDPAAASAVPAVAAALAVGGAGAALAVGGHALRAAGAAVLAFIAALAPVLAFFDVYMMRYSFVADHLAYPALVPAAVALGAALARRRLAAGAVAALFASLVALRAATFRSSEALWLEAAGREPGSWLAQVEVGLALKGRGDLDGAIERFRRALAIRESVDALVDLGNTLVDAGRAEEAIEPLSRAVEIAPENAANHVNLALALLRLERVDEAIAAYRLALEFSPDDSFLRRNLEALEAGRREASPR